MQKTSRSSYLVKVRTTPTRSVADLGSKMGAYSWLTALPIVKHGFTLHKGALSNALCVRYNSPPPGLPRECLWLNIEHALSCPIRGVAISRHTEVWDLLAGLLTDVCHDVTLVSCLQPLSRNPKWPPTTDNMNVRRDTNKSNVFEKSNMLPLYPWYCI